MLGAPWKMPRKPRRFASASSFEPGSVIGDEMRARLAACRARPRRGRRNTASRIFGSSVVARFARDDVKRSRRIDAALEAADLRGVGRVEHQQLGHGRAGARTSRRAPRGRGSIRPCREAECAKNPSRVTSAPKRSELGGALSAPPPTMSSQPSHFASSAAGPERGVARPQTPRLAGDAPLFERRLDARLERGRHRAAVGHRAGRRAARRACARRRPKSLSAASAKSRTPSSTSCARNLLDRDAAALGSAAMTAFASSMSSSRLARDLAVVAERVHRRRRHGVDRVAADQLLDIEHVAIGLVLGAGARPQQALRPRALGARAPASARSATMRLIALIGELGVGDRRPCP